MATSLTDLPLDVLVQILARLPLKSVFAARCVCRAFLTLTSSNPHFVALHCSNAAQVIAFQFSSESHRRMLALIEPELDITPGSAGYLLWKPVFHIPNVEENELRLVNSCNGLLYLARSGNSVEYQACFVCNPVTNEYLVISDLGEFPSSMWLGYSRGSNQYKILKILSSRDDYGRAQVLVVGVGTSSWRDIEVPPLGYAFTWTPYYVILDGFIYWFNDQSYTHFVCFDFEKEKFGEIALPSELTDETRIRKSICIGLLGGCLCFTCDFSQHLEIWILKYAGDHDSWHKEYVIDKAMYWNLKGQFQPLQVLKNGKILLFLRNHDLFCYDPECGSLRCANISELRLYACNYVCFFPSFASLKDALTVDEVAVNRPRPSYISRCSCCQYF